MGIPFVTKDLMSEIDRLMIEEYCIKVPIMMEYAGYNTARLARRLTKGRILVLCGKGNNGGDGLCCARHLHNWGHDVNVFLVSGNLKQEPKMQLAILQKIGVGIIDEHDAFPALLDQADLILDALFGYNLSGDPRPPYDQFIRRVNSSQKPVLSIDVPSGFDLGKGAKRDPCINATAVLCLSLPKKYLDAYDWDIYVADMSLPKALFRRIGMQQTDLFKDKTIVKIT